MGRTPIVYRWDDPGAPNLNAIMPTANDKDRLFMYTVLKACLVDGYGTQAAAGWTMPHEEITNEGCRFVLKNAANSGSLLHEGGIFSGGSTFLAAATLWSCADVPNMDSPVNAWSLAVQYEDRVAQAGSVFHKTGVYAGSTCDAWVVIANENTVVFISGRSSIEFSVNNTALSDNYTSTLVFGAMVGSPSQGGVSDPKAGNFHIAGGGSHNYKSIEDCQGFGVDKLTSIVDITGVFKTETHRYVYTAPVPETTISPLSAWLPHPIIYFQYGPSAPDGNSAARTHLAVVVPSVRKLLLRPLAIVDLNAFMSSNGFEYGEPFLYLGGQWVAFKADDSVVNVFSLESAEWGA